MTESDDETVELSAETTDSGVGEEPERTDTETREAAETTSEPLAREQSGSETAGAGEETEPVETDDEAVRIEWWESWLASVESDFDGTWTEQTRGLAKHAATWFVVQFLIGVLLGTAFHGLLALVPVTLFGSLLGNVSAVVGLSLAPWSVTVGQKVNDLFG